MKKIVFALLIFWALFVIYQLTHGIKNSKHPVMGSAYEK
jgi:hypothetical protein